MCTCHCNGLVKPHQVEQCEQQCAQRMGVGPLEAATQCCAQASNSPMPATSHVRPTGPPSQLQPPLTHTPEDDTRAGSCQHMAPVCGQRQRAHWPTWAAWLQLDHLHASCGVKYGHRTTAAACSATRRCHGPQGKPIEPTGGAWLCRQHCCPIRQVDTLAAAPPTPWEHMLFTTPWAHLHICTPH